MFHVTFFAPKTFPSEIFTKSYINTVDSMWKKGASKKERQKVPPQNNLTSLHT